MLSKRERQKADEMWYVIHAVFLGSLFLVSSFLLFVIGMLSIFMVFW